MKKLLIILAGALAIAWIAVPVAGAADVYGSSWSSVRPHDVYASTHPDPWASRNGLRPAADVYGSSWSRLHPRDVYRLAAERG
jgi:hypothetical protein